MHPVEGRGLCNYLYFADMPNTESPLSGRLLQQKHHRTRCHGNKTFSFSYFYNAFKVFRAFSLLPLLGLSAFTVHHMLEVQCSHSSKPKQKATHKIVLPSQLTLSLASFPLIPCLCHSMAQAFCGNLTQKQQFALCDTKFFACVQKLSRRVRDKLCCHGPVLQMKFFSVTQCS